MSRLVVLCVVIVGIGFLNSCREEPIIYPLTYKVTKTAGDSAIGVEVKYYVKGDYLIDTLRDTNMWSAEWTARSGEFISLEATSFESAAHLTLEILNDDGPFELVADSSSEYLKNPKITKTLE